MLHDACSNAGSQLKPTIEPTLNRRIVLNHTILPMSLNRPVKSFFLCLVRHYAVMWRGRMIGRVAGGLAMEQASCFWKSSHGPGLELWMTCWSVIMFRLDVTIHASSNNARCSMFPFSHFESWKLDLSGWGLSTSAIFVLLFSLSLINSSFMCMISSWLLLRFQMVLHHRS